jgi:Tfp pilus assembly protein PilN
MKAVNLIPREHRSTRGVAPGSLGLAHGVIAVLLVAVAFASIYVLEKNTISDRQAKLASLRAQVSQTQALASSLTQFISYEQLAQQRAVTVRSIIASRFDWDTALTELSQVVPTGTSFQSLLGTVVPGATVGGTSAGSADTGGLRSAIAVPAFEIRGCTSSQDDVANLMSRLRLINGVTRVTLADSQKSGGAPGAAAGASTGGGPCRGGAPSFDLVVFFTAVPNAGTDGVAAATGVASDVGASATAGAQPASTTGGSQ